MCSALAINQSSRQNRMYSTLSSMQLVPTTLAMM